MAWINLEVMGDGDKVKDIKSVRIMTDDDGEPAMFATMAEADYWCESHYEPGALYEQIEIWG
jgi:hypothetical protein